MFLWKVLSLKSILSNRLNVPRATVSLGLLMSSVILLVGCAGNQIPDDPDLSLVSETELYDVSQRAMRSRNFATAVEKLELLESHFPFGPYAEQAKLDTIFSYFMQSDFQSAGAAADTFIRTHPQHQNVDYAYYLKGLSSYESNRTFFDRFLGAPEHLRDVSAARQSFTEFSELLMRFPNSLYAKDARLRMVHLRNIMARHEIEIAEFYLARDAYVAAMNRANGVVENFPNTEMIPDALAILVETNVKLGLEREANDALRVLRLNFPDYRGFNDEGDLVLDYARARQDRSFLNLLTFGILGREEIPPPLRVSEEAVASGS